MDLSAPLPDGHGPKPVDQNQRRLGGGFIGGPPEVEGGLVIHVHLLGGEAGGDEAAAEVAPVDGDDARKRWEHTGWLWKVIN